ncbi:DUF1642 domain-containing protein [Streptococcus suis]|uniref:DUF1642 domain-containing protein n=1 Tax=Streptococcus suis TaxID=1307 RepID=UPI000768A1D2|nr:DUF1642 domain-containing protein [Streptococcus suis]NQH14993.1 DUF1642 domain-containing protein [Streptococcus suis]CYU87702.1 phage protein [Streptococcus suis]HEM3480738.1 DUF1642 domain-containing protein [Streptococcus suis]
MNKHELEKQAEALYTDVRSFLDNTFELIDQIDQPQKVVVPKFVAEWIKKCKDMNYSLRDAMKITKLSTKLNVWFLERGQDMFSYPNQEIFARAWLDGYEIEQGKLYTVELFNGQPLVEVNNILYFGSDSVAPNAHVSKDKLEAAGFGWVFDCNGVKVVEVER